MSETTIISMRRYSAHRTTAKLRRLPRALRTPARAAPAVEAIVAYAWEPGAVTGPAEPARICDRLEEFVPPAPSGRGQWGLVRWLYANLLPEAWDSPTLLKPLLRDCLRDG